MDELINRELDTPVYFLRIDPNQVWLRPFLLQQDDVMWILQLKKERNIYAQYEALQGRVHDDILDIDNQIRKEIKQGIIANPEGAQMEDDESTDINIGDN